MAKKMNKNSKKGFTLVELIVVLVILAILAAILIPALLGYIDRAREKQDLLDARCCLQAAQAQLAELYGQSEGNPPANTPVIPGGAKPTDKNGDVDLTQADFAQKVLETADLTGANEPYILMMALGSNQVNDKAEAHSVTAHDKYTVYYILYIKTEKSKPLYYYNGTWTKDNPRATGTTKQTEIFSEYNVVKKGPLQGKRLQYYLLANGRNDSVETSSFWNWVKGLK